jgi:hypothetical protein
VKTIKWSSIWAVTSFIPVLFDAQHVIFGLKKNFEKLSVLGGRMMFLQKLLAENCKI